MHTGIAKHLLRAKNGLARVTRHARGLAPYRESSKRGVAATFSPLSITRRLWRFHPLKPTSSSIGSQHSTRRECCGRGPLGPPSFWMYHSPDSPKTANLFGGFVQYALDVRQQWLAQYDREADQDEDLREDLKALKPFWKPWFRGHEIATWNSSQSSTEMLNTRLRTSLLAKRSYVRNSKGVGPSSQRGSLCQHIKMTGDGTA
jgi:hypothetical protein